MTLSRDVREQLEKEWLRLRDSIALCVSHHCARSVEEAMNSEEDDEVLEPVRQLLEVAYSVGKRHWDRELDAIRTDRADEEKAALGE